MNFINPFAFLVNYFNRTGDAQNEKIGHVNAVIEELNNLNVGSDEIYVEVAISSAQILTSGSNRIELLPAIPNSYYQGRFIIEYTFGTTPYTTATSFGLVFGDSFLLVSLLTDTQTGIIENKLSLENRFYTVNQGVYFQCLPTLDEFNNLIPVDPVGGDGTVLVKIWYKVRTFGTEL